MPMGCFEEHCISTVREEMSRTCHPARPAIRSERSFLHCVLLSHLSKLRVFASEGARTKRLRTDDSAKVTLLHRADVSQGSSTESARATVLQRGGASRGSSTELAGAILLQGSDASIPHTKKNH